MSSTGGRFAGKVAIVTGATADPSIGRSTATILASEGAKVVINGRDETQMRAAIADLTAQGFTVDGVAGSMEDDDVAEALVDKAIDRFGRIDLLVNTVGGSRG
jgi:NAD(P)-dependent dehydrogenase (short-subunit alcohol dehydrogenase family)